MTDAPIHCNVFLSISRPTANIDKCNNFSRPGIGQSKIMTNKNFTEKVC